MVRNAYLLGRMEERVHLMWKAPKEYNHFAFGLIQSGITSAITSGVSTAQFVAEGTFVSHWLSSFLLSWIVMLPVVIVAAPVIRWLANRITQ